MSIRNVFSPRIITSIAIGAVLFVVGCSGGGNTVPVGTSPHTQPSPTTQQSVSFVVRVPRKITTDYKPAYVSPSTQSITFATSADGVTYGNVQVVPINTADPTQCTSTGGFYTCTAFFDAPPGNIYVQVKTYASKDGSGAVLSENTIEQTIVIDTDNAVNVTLNGVVATFSLTLAPQNVQVGVPSTTNLTWNGVDSSGNTIIGPGGLVDSTGSIISPTLTIANNPSDFGTPQYDVPSNTWTISYDGANIPNQTLTVSATNIPDASATLIVGTAVPTPVPSPTASPTPSPTPSPSPTPPGGNVLLNSDFESGSLSPWYQCYASHALSGPVDPNPAASPIAQPTTQPTSAPTPNASVQSTITHSGTYAVQIGKSGVSPKDYGRGLEGICQDVQVPIGGQLTLWVWEGGNTDDFSKQDAEADIFTADTGMSASTPSVVALPTQTLFAELNCYDSDGGGKTATCLPSAIPAPPGGQWYEKGPYDLSAYGGETVSVFIGTWGYATSSTYYNYAYFDDLVLEN